ncbi:MAG TPA: SDR family oxidoreductase [Defluviicoccus sp.]|nr:SDR family oxidoreductase [Defluviicoccus sp.]
MSGAGEPWEIFRPDLLRGKRVLVTGGGTGLGLSMGRRFLELGASLVICGRRGSVLEEAADRLKADTGGEIGWHVLDIRDAAAVDATIGRIFAEAPLDVLVNNAAGNFAARSETLSPRALDAVVNIVLHGSAYVTLACGRRWIAAKHPATVLSILATYAWTGSPYVLPSAMAKAGLLAMTRSLAVEWGPKGIRFNAIAPGPFPTPGAWSRLVPRADLAAAFETSNPLGRPGKHSELANLAAFLISDGATFINGDCVTIDGGEWMQGAGEFCFLDKLTEAEWEAMRPQKGGRVDGSE